MESPKDKISGTCSIVIGLKQNLRIERIRVTNFLYL